MQNISIIVAHPDDETIGCGATILKLKQLRKNINLLTLSDGVSSRSTNKKALEVRKKNFKKVLKSYNFKKFCGYDFPDNSFDKVPLIEIVKKIENFIKETKTDTIFTHFGRDLNIDHQKTFEAVVTAARPFPRQTVKNIFCFEVNSSTDWTFSNRMFKPNMFIDINKFINKKLKILKLYGKEIKKNPHTRSFQNIKRLAEFRGNSVGYKFCEAFEVYKTELL